jgi:hypothetical protein
LRKNLTKQIQKEIHRADAERKAIIRETSPEKLFEILCNNPDSLNHEVLKAKILQHESFLVPLILKKLITNRDDFFIEVAILVLYEARKNWVPQIESTILKIRDPYNLSLICVVLGLIGAKSSIPFVWRAFHVFKRMKSKYINGPLLALAEFQERHLI